MWGLWGAVRSSEEQWGVVGSSGAGAVGAVESYGELWGAVGSCGELWGAMGSHWELQELLGVVESCREQWELWGAVGSCGEVWGGVGKCGEVWGAVGSCEYCNERLLHSYLKYEGDASYIIISLAPHQLVLTTGVVFVTQHHVHCYPSHHSYHKVKKPCGACSVHCCDIPYCLPRLLTLLECQSNSRPEPAVGPYL